VTLQPERIASAELHIGDCLDVLPKLAADGLRAHCCVTDPPYHLTSIVKRFGADDAAPVKPGVYARSAAGFMGKTWDGGDVAFRLETWRAVFECLLPGAHLVAFGGTRTFHRMACAIEDAGFEIRDTLCWLYGSGFPKSLDVSKAIDRAAGAEREVVGPGRWNCVKGTAGKDGGITPDGYVSHGGTQHSITAPATPEAAQWAGWGTALKPAFEPIILARKPLDGTVAANTLRHGCGGLNVAACRVVINETLPSYTPSKSGLGKNGIYGASAREQGANSPTRYDAAGRWPANVVLSDDPEVEAAFAAFGERATGDLKPYVRANRDGYSGGMPAESTFARSGDTGSASRFFFTSKADKADRAGSSHPTVKPTDLMRWLVRLVCPPGGLVLDPFAGSGSTGLAADQCGMRSVLVERDPTYAGDALRKIREDAPLFAEPAAVPDLDAAYQRTTPDLFAEAAD
jgi:DNA modification methylase